MNKPQQVRVTQVKINGHVVWRDPAVVYIEWIEKMEKKIDVTNFKESKDVIAKIMSKGKDHGNV